MKYSPKYAWCYYAYGVYYDYVNQKDDAYTNFLKAVKLDPDSLELRGVLDEFKKINDID